MSQNDERMTELRELFFESAQELLQAANIAAAQAQLEGSRATALRNHLEADRQNKLLATRIAGTTSATARTATTATETKRINAARLPRPNVHRERNGCQKAKPEAAAAQ